jgi:hypothetical protein
MVYSIDGKMRNVYILVGTWYTGTNMEDNTEMDLTVIGCGNVNCIEMGDDRIQWKACLVTMILCVPYQQHSS